MLNRYRKNHQNQPNRRSGYTIAEMIIVIGIMAVLAGIGGGAYLRERDRFEFNNSLIKMLQLIKTVRTYAVTSFPIYLDSATGNVIPVNGYGIHFKLDQERGKSMVTIFANTGTDPENFEPAEDKVMETYAIPKQIDFRYFWFGNEKKWQPETPTQDAGPTAKEGVLIFKPPLGEMTIGDNASQPLEELSLQFENPASDGAGPKKCQKITIRRVKRFPELTYSPLC